MILTCSEHSGSNVDAASHIVIVVAKHYNFTWHDQACACPAWQLMQLQIQVWNPAESYTTFKKVMLFSMLRAAGRLECLRSGQGCMFCPCRIVDAIFLDGTHDIDI